MYVISKTDYDGRGNKYVMITLSPKEAAGLIRSLAEQLERGNPNTGRIETMYKTTDGSGECGYISVAVDGS